MISNTIKNLKYIVNSGCSYGQLVSSFLNYISPLNECTQVGRYDKKIFLDNSMHIDKMWNEYVFIDVSAGGMTSEYITDSIIHCVDLLKQNGIPSSQIYVISEFTNFFRPTIHKTIKVQNDEVFNINSDLEKKYINNIQIICDKKYNEIQKIFLKENIKLSSSSTFITLGDMFYINAQGTNEYENIPNTSKNFKNFLSDMNRFKEGLKLETLSKLYIDNILRLQYYLKLNKIKYNSFFINSQLSHIEEYNGNIIIKKLISEASPFYITSNNRIKRNINFKEYYNSNKKNDLISIYPELKQWVDKIDFTNWWTYETDEIRYGGIDEYAIYNFDWYGYLKEIQDASQPEQIPKFTNHPAKFVYVLLWNDITKNLPELHLCNNYLRWILNSVKEISTIEERTSSYLLDTTKFHKKDIYSDL